MSTPFCSLFALACICSMQVCAEDHKVEIISSCKNVNGKVVYSYKVKNYNSVPVWRILIGYKQETDTLYLDEKPSAILSPKGWMGEFQFDEAADHPVFLVEWRQPASKPELWIQKGETKTGFAMVVGSESENFAVPPFQIFFNDNSKFSGTTIKELNLSKATTLKNKPKLK